MHLFSFYQLRAQIRVSNLFLWSNWSTPSPLPTNTSLSTNCTLLHVPTPSNNGSNGGSGTVPESIVNTVTYIVTFTTLGSVGLVAMVAGVGLSCLCCLNHKKKRNLIKQLLSVRNVFTFLVNCQILYCL